MKWNGGEEGYIRNEKERKILEISQILVRIYIRDTDKDNV